MRSRADARHTHLKKVGAALLLLAAAGDAMAADAIGIASVNRSSTDARKLFVILATPLPAPEIVNSGAAWQVRVFLPPAPQPISVVAAQTAANYVTTRRVTLTLQSDIPANAIRVEVTLLAAN